MIEVIRSSRDGSKYLTRFHLMPSTRWGQLRLHWFHRGDEGPLLHDHAADFWTFPLVGYIEANESSKGVSFVRPWWLHYRPAEYRHRIITAAVEVGGSGLVRWVNRPIITLVWRRPSRRRWGFHDRNTA